MTILIFVLKAISFVVGTLFLGALLGVVLSATVCKALGVPIAPKGTAYLAGKGWFFSVLHGSEEQLGVAKFRHRIDEISAALGWLLVGLFLFVGLFTDYPMSPAGLLGFLGNLAP
jgi:hypothetical protein